MLLKHDKKNKSSIKIYKNQKTFVLSFNNVDCNVYVCFIDYYQNTFDRIQHSKLMEIPKEMSWDNIRRRSKNDL